MKTYASDFIRPCVGAWCQIRLIDSNSLRPILPYKYNQKSLTNQLAGIIHRYGRAMPQPTVDTRKFYAYGCAFISLYVPKCTKDDVIDYDTWLRESSYSCSRKVYLDGVRHSLYCIWKKTCDSKSFVKDECYCKPKQPRLINSPSDESKVILGPLQKAMDHKMFTDPVCGKWFIKGTNPATWTERMEQAFAGRKVINTDFTSFECHHRGDFARLVWKWQEHMWGDLCLSAGHKNMIRRLIRGTNFSALNRCTSLIDETLMSGVPWTSSANAILNLLINSYSAMVALHPTYTAPQLAKAAINFNGLFEGDDGIFEDYGQSTETTKALGVVLKFDRFPDYSTAKFCSMVVPRGESALAYDFKKAFMTFTLLPASLAQCRETTCRALLRAKAMSYMHMYHSSPIVGALAYKVLDLTRSLDIRPVLHTLEERKREIIHAALQDKSYLRKPTVSDASRIVYEQVFKISPDEQIRIEQEILNSPGPEISANISGYFSVQDLALDDHCSPFYDPEIFPTNPPELVKQIVADGRLKGKSRTRCLKVDNSFGYHPVHPYYQM